MPKEILKNLNPRRYQEDIYNKCIDKNCLVVLPTGVGKTLIALMLSIHRLKKFPREKILFLAPTRPLAEQHLEYFKKNLPELFAELILFTGKINKEKRKELWDYAEIIFSTPQCIANDLKNHLYDLSEVSLLIEDECHRCLKNYAYTYIATVYKDQGKNQRILGLTASPGTDIKTIEEIKNNLGIEAIEIRTRESEDVKEYLQELEFELVRVQFPVELKEISEDLKKIFQKKIEELKNRKLLFEPPTKTNIIKLQSSLMRQISSGNKHFNNLVGASVCAQAIKISYLIELVETQTLFSAINYVRTMFEQARDNKSKAVKQIVRSSEFNSIYIRLNELFSRGIEHPKISRLKEIIKESIIQNPKNKTIIFSQYRDTVLKITRELNQIESIKSKVFVGQTKKGDSGLSQKEQQEIMREFKEGKINIIAATSIGEEGLDIPEVNSVIFYEPIPSAIRKIQRAGRTARLMKGKLFIMITEDTLDEIFYYASKSKEKRMYKSIETIKKDLENPKLIQNQTLIEIKEKNKEIEKVEPKNKDQKTLF